MKSFKYAFFEGKVIDLENAKISIMTNALQYGTGVFGGIRGYYDNEGKTLSIFRIRDHYKRFLSSIKLMGCAFPYTLDQLVEIHIDLAKKNSPTCNSYFRPFAYVGNTSLGPNLHNVTLDYALYMIPLEEYMPLGKGLSLMVSSWRRIGDNSIPARGKFCGAYLNSAFARKEANDNGFDEAILLSEHGHVCEGSAENLFIIRDGVLITPAPSDDILEGITRRTLLQIATDNDIPVIERSIDRSELYAADEVFLSGTGCQLAWVHAIDRRIISNEIGPISSKLRDEYFATVRGKVAKYNDWCTKVSV
ncbi:MAG: branched-chain amino acid aminotransferase [Burkholderiales bacterium]|jgi:branched-chain amino acid aminotransferase|nr:branched-chain amino acid aminotransferase [Burkholderiales bacterium]